MKKGFTPLETGRHRRPSGTCPVRNNGHLRHPISNGACGALSLTGFTLVELMVAVCILAIGLVGIARSLLNAVSALDYCNNLMNKMTYLDNAMCELQEKIDEKEGFKSDDQAIRDFLQEKINQAKENEAGQLDWSAETSGISKNMTEFEFRLSWQEGNSGKSVKLASYLSSPTKKQTEQP